MGQILCFIAKYSAHYLLIYKELRIFATQIEKIY